MNIWLVIIAFVTLSVTCSRALPSPQKNTQGLQWNGEYDVEEEDEVDSDEKELIAIRDIFTSRLGLTNFTGSAIAEKAADVFVNYLNRNIATPVPPRKPATPPAEVELKAAEDVPSTTPPAPVILTTMMNGTSAVIQIRFPPMTQMHHMMTPMEMIVTAPPHRPRPHSPSNSNDNNNQGAPGETEFSNIEAAIVEALAQAQKMAIGDHSTNSTSSSSSSSSSGTGTALASPSSSSSGKAKTKGSTRKKPQRRDPLYGFGPMIDWFGKWVLRQGEELLL